MWRFVSAARMAQIKADARAEGYIKAVREGLAANDAAKEDRIVTSENTQTANTAVQEAVHDMHKRVDAAQKQVAAGKASQKRAIGKRRRIYRGKRFSEYTDKDIVLIQDGDVLENYVVNTMHHLSLQDMVSAINRDLGSHVRGKYHPMRITSQLLSKVINRKVYWKKDLGYFIRQNGD